MSRPPLRTFLPLVWLIPLLLVIALWLLATIPNRFNSSTLPGPTPEHWALHFGLSQASISKWSESRPIADAPFQPPPRFRDGGAVEIRPSGPHSSTGIRLLGHGYVSIYHEYWFNHGPFSWLIGFPVTIALAIFGLVRFVSIRRTYRSGGCAFPVEPKQAISEKTP